MKGIASSFRLPLSIKYLGRYLVMMAVVTDTRRRRRVVMPLWRPFLLRKEVKR
tara:strand:+ start:294 stop:452 length:159 start_codon:yes stop_codon:yes gene_type:complete